MQEGSPFSATLPTFVVVCLLDGGDPYWCEVISHCGFNLHFPDDKRCGASFHVSVGHKMANFMLCKLYLNLKEKKTPKTQRKWCVRFVLARAEASVAGAE